MADNLAKRPSKGILKNSSSFDKPESSTNPLDNRRKSKETKWDEMNIIATLHPADKDYGHMKIDEPKTPYNYEADEPIVDQDELDAAELAAKIQSGGSALPKFMKKQENEDSDGDEDDDLTEEEKARRKEFLAKRKKHYNEYYAVKLARKQLDEESEEDEDASEGTEMDIEKEQSPSPPPINNRSKSPSSHSHKTGCNCHLLSCQCSRRSRSSSPQP